jgi:hypothetical protein
MITYFLKFQLSFNITVGCRLPSQDPMARAAGVGASGGVEDDGSRMTKGFCSEITDRSFFLGTK